MKFARQRGQRKIIWFSIINYIYDLFLHVDLYIFVAENHHKTMPIYILLFSLIFKSKLLKRKILDMCLCSLVYEE